MRLLQAPGVAGLRVRILAAAFLLASAGACTDYIVVTDGAATSVVLGVIVTGEDSVFLSVGRSGPGTSAAPEPGASLILEIPGGDVPLLEVDAAAFACGAPIGFSCYLAALPVALAPGQAVRLRGTLASGAEVRGSTVTPAVPPIRVGGLEPGATVRWRDLGTEAPTVELVGESGRVVPRDSVLVATVWRGGEERTCPAKLSSPAPGVHLGSSIGAFPQRVFLEDPICDRQRVADWDSLAASLVFLGLDPHATAWAVAEGGFWPGEGERRGLEGVVGVFGSATAAEFHIRITARHLAH